MPEVLGEESGTQQPFDFDELDRAEPEDSNKGQSTAGSASQRHRRWASLLGHWGYGDRCYEIRRDSEDLQFEERLPKSGLVSGTLQPDGCWLVAELYEVGRQHVGAVRLRFMRGVGEAQATLVSNFRNNRRGAPWGPDVLARRLSRQQAVVETTRDAPDAGVGEVLGMDAYRACVREALAHESHFAMFKRDQRYRVVLEHVWPSLGAQYLACITRDSPALWEELGEAVCRNNALGAPLLHKYDAIGEVSPTQLRYLKVLSDLRHLLPSLNGLNIAEFGVGYGGQCQLIMAGHRVASYLLIDFPEVELLALQYLQKSAPADRLPSVSLYQNRQKSGGGYGRGKRFDLFISNYAFSELNVALQRQYFKDVVQSCQHGYVTYNSAVDAGAMPVDAFVELLQGAGHRALVASEEPLSVTNCCVVTW